MKKVICVTIYALTPQIERYLLIQDMIEAGVKIECWDLKGIYFRGHHFENTISREYIREINSFQELKNHLKNEDLAETVFVLQVYFEWRVLSLYFIMNSFGCKTAHFPFVHARRSLIVSAVDKLRPKYFSRTFLNLIARLCRKVGLIKKYDLVFATGQLTRNAFKDHKRVVHINYQDYDYYQLSKNKAKRIIAEDYCVFLDEGCVHNSNVKLLKMEELDPEKFYGALNHFFDEIEKKLNLKVVIAAHPGIHYDKSTFPGRCIYEGKACELVKDCKFVISQSSTSTSFAVLYKKPIVLVYTNEYAVKRRTGFRILEFLSTTLRLKSYNIDRGDSFGRFEIPTVNTSLYDNYKYSCLTSKESENHFTKEIVIQALKGC